MEPETRKEEELDHAYSGVFGCSDDIPWEKGQGNDGRCRSKRWFRRMVIYMVVVLSRLPLRDTGYCGRWVGSHTSLPQNLSYASTAQTVGLTAGHFLSYTVFLAFNSPDFANRWFRSAPSTEGVMTLGGYLTFWGWGYLLVTVGLAILKKEDKTKERDGILEVYKSMLGVLKLRNIQSIIVIHLIAKIGFQANDAVTNLKLLDKGFSQEDMALTVLIDFPFEISLGYYAGRWSTSNPQSMFGAGPSSADLSRLVSPNSWSWFSRPTVCSLGICSR